MTTQKDMQQIIVTPNNGITKIITPLYELDRLSKVDPNIHAKLRCPVCKIVFITTKERHATGKPFYCKCGTRYEFVRYME